MVDNISSLVPYAVFFSHIILVLLVFALISKNALTINFIGRNAVGMAFAVSLLAIVGSLFYSEVIGFEPCVLCWWQRVFLYPLPIILGIALWQRDKYIFLYVIPLVTLSAIIALYQSYANLGGTSLLPCTAVGGACSKVYVKEFGYITIPLMSLTISLYILLIAWIKKIYDKNSHA